jgi:hypothetical protein
MMYRCLALAAVVVMALLQTGCILAPSILGTYMLFAENNNTPSQPVWQMEPPVKPTSEPSLPNLSTADPHATVAAAR